MKTFKASVGNVEGRVELLRTDREVIVLTETRESIWFLIDAESRTDVRERVQELLGVWCHIARTLSPREAWTATRNAQNEAMRKG